MTTWKAADAKRHFSQLLEGAARSPQLVLLRGRPVGVVVGYEEFILTKKGQGEKDLSSWIDDLKALHAEEGDMELKDRGDRPDPFGK